MLRKSHLINGRPSPMMAEKTRADALSLLSAANLKGSKAKGFLVAVKNFRRATT